MEAKDTVINRVQIVEILRQLIESDEVVKSPELAVAKAQAEISFKAGIREVVEWIRAHQLVKPDENSLARFEPFYQITLGELKEWGL